MHMQAAGGRNVRDLPLFRLSPLGAFRLSNQARVKRVFFAPNDHAATTTSRSEKEK